MKKTCSTVGCDGDYFAKNLCKRHYYAKRYADIQAGILPAEPCQVDGCNRPRWARGWCSSHYNAKRDSERRAVVRQEQRPCVVCGGDLTGRRPNAMYCTIRCKERAEWERKRGTPDYKAKARRRYLRAEANRRDKFMAWAYGVSPEQYAALLESQGGVCAICKAAPVSRRLAVDHDHATGAIRGLLCGSCNNGLGRFKDDPVRIRAALEYLAR